MVENPRATPGADPIRPLNPPVPVEVQESTQQRPVAIQIRDRWMSVSSIDDLCNVDEEWWRERPIVRMYYQVRLEDSRSITVFRDMVDGKWYRQNG